MTTNTISPSYEDPTVVAVDPSSTSSKRQQRIDKAMVYFSSFMFLVQIILAAVFSGIELHYGVDYRYQCPIEPMIPIFLIVHGATKFVWVAMSILAFINARIIYGMMNKAFARHFVLPSLLFQLVFALWFFAWFIAGNVWVFSNKSHVQSTDAANTSTYCQNTLYSAAFGLIISTYIVFGIVAVLTIKRRIVGKKIKEKLPSNPDGNHNKT
ncbi:unnamed protein product [Rotaria sordida]|uniref:MARVEL domain-containing protein n=1 Tax=Rotaria sordida TaxID=392033 RepID=A0A815C918_9BILA|nr:unnamed protein product [Rotaria sordida]CAF1280466.1 unnamed protein product [Rotaria sordida]